MFHSRRTPVLLLGGWALSSLSHTVDVNCVGGQTCNEEEENERRPSGWARNVIPLGVEEDGRSRPGCDREGGEELGWGSALQARHVNAAVVVVAALD
jgi:hypothetical protein